MKLKEKMKRFWTLSRHHAEGFTLVELIVVIAILAILAGVAVPVYSTYIKQANMQADQSLASEVANALLLHYYSNSGSEIGYVILAPEGIEVTTPANAFGTAAMQAAFGANWQSTLVLKYGEWKDNGMLAAGMAGGQDVLNSSFLKDNSPGELLGQVTGVIGTTVDFLVSKGYEGELLYDKMVENMDEETMLAACTKLGIPVVYDNDGNATSFGDVSNEQLANLMVFVASKEYLDAASGGESEPSNAGNIMYMYTTYMAAANSSYGSKKMQEDLVASLDGNSVSDIISNLQTFATTYEAELEKYSNDPDNTGENLVDGNAIVNMLTAVDKVKESGDVKADALNDGSFFESDTVNAYMNTYLAAAQLVADLNVPEGAFVIFLVPGENGPSISSSAVGLLAQ